MAQTFATWDPDNKNANLVLSNGNLTSDTTYASYVSGLATQYKASGKWYWEVTVNSTDVYIVSGIGTSSINMYNYVGRDANGIGYLYDGSVRQGNVTIKSYTSISPNDVIGVALDLDNGELYFSRNGTWQGSSNPLTRTNPCKTGLSGNWYPAISHSAVAGNNPGATTNFGASTFTYTVPTGYNEGVFEGSSAPTECLAKPGIIEITGSATLQYNKATLAEPGIINISGSASSEKTLNAKTIKLQMIKTGQGLPFNLELKPDYTDCNDPSYYFRYAFNPDCLFVNTTVTIAVEGGVAPFDWAISGSYFTLGSAQTGGRTNTVTCPDGTDAYQDEIVYVTDSCGNTVEGTVRYCPHNWNPITPLVMYDKWVPQTLTGPFAECMGIQVIGNTAYFLLFMITEPFGHQLYKWSPGDESLTAVTTTISPVSSYLGTYLIQANGILYALTAYQHPLVKYAPGVDDDWVVLQEECDLSELISINNQPYGKDGSGFYSFDVFGNETYVAPFTGGGNLEYDSVTNTLINCNRVYSSYIQQYDFGTLELKNSCIWPHSAVINSVICNNAMYFTHSSSSGGVYKITIGTDTYEDLIVDGSFSLLYSRFTKFKNMIFCVAWETGILKIMDEDNKQWVNVATPELEGSTIFAGEHTFSIGNSLYGLVYAKSADVGLVIFKWA